MRASMFDSKGCLSGCDWTKTCMSDSKGCLRGCDWMRVSTSTEKLQGEVQLSDVLYKA